ncbi:MAG: hypothetical protein IMF15_01000 [Proteobacteria bacterium]|nr:hypothetical protein [Pseudomonadota bacterium]
MKQRIVLIVCLLFLSQSVFAVDPGLDWKTIESEHLYVHFADGNKELAERALAIAEGAHEHLTKKLDWNPVEKTHIILSDETDQPNGFATPIYFNRTVLFLAPPTSVNTLEDFDDWFTTLITHEYTHIVHLDKSAGSPEYLRNIFGRFVFLFPNLFQPSWVHEGLATYVETDLDRGVGRGQSTLFASMMREELAKGLQPISHVNLPVSTWPAGTTRYLYGVYFMNFLAEKYGEEKMQAWIEEYSDNLLPFFINTNANQTLGKNLTPLWQEYQQWLKEKFQPQITAIKARGVKSGEQLSAAAYRTDSVRAISTDEGDEIYYVSNSGYKRATLMLADAEGNTRELLSLNNIVNLDVHPKSGLLLTQNEFCNNYTIYSDIYSYDKKNDELKRLTECGRFLFASWSADGKHIAAVHHDVEHFELQLLDAEAKLKEVLWRGNDGEIIGQIDVSPDGGNIVASVWRKGKGWNVELFNITAQRWQNITTGVSIAANPQYDPDGNVLFSLEADGVYNLYRYDTETASVNQITNLIGGAFQSSQASSNGAVYYAGYSAEGYAIYSLDDASSFSQAPAFKDDRLQLIDYSVTPHEQRDYSALSNMYPRWWFPAWLFTDQRSELGLTTAGSDALGIHNYFITASYDFKLDKPAANVSYAYSDRLFLSVARANDIALDANGEVSRISNHSVVSAVLAFPNNYIQRQSDLLFSVIYDNTADDELAAGAVPSDDFEDHLLGIAWLFNSANTNPLSISPVDGMNLRLVAEDSDALNSDFSGQVYTLDWRQYIRTGKESVLALRFLQGWGTDQPRPFELGGEGSSDSAVSILFGTSTQAVFDARSYALRGYKEGLPQLRGRRAQVLSGEWRFPLQRIERGIMAPPVGLMQWFGTVFAETGSAYFDSPDSYYTGAGAEIDADVNIFYAATLRVRLGYAHGFDDDIGEDLFYLRIGSSF